MVRFVAFFKMFVFLLCCGCVASDRAGLTGAEMVTVPIDANAPLWRADMDMSTFRAGAGDAFVVRSDEYASVVVIEKSEDMKLSCHWMDFKCDPENANGMFSAHKNNCIGCGRYEFKFTELVNRHELQTGKFQVSLSVVSFEDEPEGLQVVLHFRDTARLRDLSSHFSKREQVWVAKIPHHNFEGHRLEAFDETSLVYSGYLYRYSNVNGKREKEKEWSSIYLDLNSSLIVYHSLKSFASFSSDAGSLNYGYKEKNTK